ncbi:MAG: undecaprenyldiphospho-muramoylpentapeptide beta-N-acetylglucosaminyltransferase [Desulfovibrionaceae bacterium]
MKRLLLATGGTGGHVFPALAVAEEIRCAHPDCDILFMGGSGPEGDMARRAGLRFMKLPVRGVLGRGLRGLAALGRMAFALMLALHEIQKFKPQAAAGFGGYAGFCPILAAWMRGVPTCLHEQNSVPGAANRVLGKLVRRVCVSFEQSRRHFPASKVLRTGNPVRRAIVGARDPERRGRNLLVLGGSQGARDLSSAVIDALPRLREAGVEVLHQAGHRDLQRVRSGYSDQGADSGRVVPFIEDMAGAYAQADLAVARAGASTVFELAAAGVPAVLVPFPHATHDHQTKNAAALAEAGGALVLDQAEAGGKLANAVISLLDEPDRLTTMARSTRDFAAPAAARDVAMEIEALAAGAQGAMQ